MGHMRVTIDHGSGGGGPDPTVIVVIVALLLLAASGAALARAAEALLMIALVTIGTLAAGAVIIAVVLWQIRRHSALSPRTGAVRAQVITAVPEARGPRSLAGSDSAVRGPAGLSALINPGNGHSYLCPCLPCARFWDSESGILAYLEAERAGKVPNRLYRAILPASEPGER